MKYPQIYDPEVNAFIKELIYAHCAGTAIPEETADEIIFRCPFCGDSRQSMKKKRGHYYKKTGSFYCFNGGCNKPSSWQRLASKITGMSEDIIEAEMMKRRLNGNGTIDPGAYLKELEAQAQRSKDFVDRVMGISPFPVECKLPENLVHWKNLLLTKNFIEQRFADMGEFKPDNLDFWYSHEKKRLIIPWLDEAGNIIYWQGRAMFQYQMDMKYTFPKGSQVPVFFMKQDESWPFYVCVEGVFNGIWVKNGLVTGSCKCTRLQKQMLEIARARGKRLIWLLDNDKNPVASPAALKRMCKDPFFANDLFFSWPCELDAYKDVNDTILALEKNLFNDSSFIQSNSISALEMMMRLEAKFGSQI